MARHHSDKSGKNRPKASEPAEKYGEEGADDMPSWLSRAADRYEKRQQGYESLLSGARDALAKDKAELSEMLRKSEPGEDEAPPPPPIFDEAAQAYQERQKSLGSMFDDAVRARQREREALSQMFGPRTGKKPPRR